MKTLANLSIATLPRSGVWGADDCGEPNNLLAVSEKCQEKLPQQFSEPTSDFLAWGAQPVRRSKSSDEARLPPLREKTRSPKSETGFGQGFSVRKRSAVRGGSLGLRGAPQAQRGAEVKLGIQPKAVTKPARPRTAGAKPFFAASSLFRECKKNVIFKHQMNRLPLLFTYVYLLLTLDFIGDNNA